MSKEGALVASIQKSLELDRFLGARAGTLRIPTQQKRFCSVYIGQLPWVADNLGMLDWGLE